MAQVEKVPCEDCGNLVARTSKLCPYCNSKGPNSGRNTLGCIGVAAVVIIFGGSWLVNEVKSGLGLAVPKAAEAATKSNNETISEGPRAGRDDPHDADSISQSAPRTSVEESVKEDATAAEPSQPEAAKGRSDPGADPKVRQAMREAFDTGKPVRWKAMQMKGYAVPSSASSDGCRSVRYSVDGHDVDEFAAVKICP